VPDHPRPSFYRRCVLAGLASAVAFSATFAAQPKQPPAQTQPGAPAKKEFEMTEKVREAFGKLKPLEDAQNWNGILEVLNAIPVAPGSYDEAMVLNSKATTYIKKNDLGHAIEPLERAIKLSDEHGYFPPKVVNDLTFFLAQLYAAEGSTIKVPAEGQPGRKEAADKQQGYFSKALVYFKRVLENTPKPTPEMLQTYASILYYKAAADPNNVDQAVLKEARAVVERGLQASIKPKEGFYQLLLTILQQQNDLAGSADVLELLLKQAPTKSKDLWQLLMATYLQLAEKSRDKDPALSREYMTRAIVTMERAQALGFLNTPKDNMNLVTLYLTGVNQFTKGTEMLYNGMKNGKIENEPNNWRVLGRYYMEANMNTQATAVLQEATKIFPKNGEIEIQLAQLYIQMEKTKDAFEHAKAAAAKGNFEASTKPFSVYYLIAYTAYELGELEEAQKAIAQAEKIDPQTAAKDQQFPKLKNVVVEAVQEREAKKKEKEAAAEKNKKGKS
jgi:tetratricopeptide (TPR) repeat protein